MTGLAASKAPLIAEPPWLSIVTSVESEERRKCAAPRSGHNEEVIRRVMAFCVCPKVDSNESTDLASPASTSALASS